TTILNMLAGFQQPDQAFIKINDHILTDTTLNVNVMIQKRNIGYLFQDYQLFPNMTVFKNITFLTKYSQHIDYLKNQLNIVNLKDKFPIRLSGGESQRVALAITLSTKPDLMLLDEPFSSLDDATKEESILLVKRIFKLWNIPIIFVTHSQYEAEILAHEIINIGDMQP